MRRILFIAVSNIAKRNGVGLATLAYYNSLCQLYPGMVDLMMPESACTGLYSKAIGVPPRPRFKAIMSGSMHRYKKFLYNYLLNNVNQYSLCIINGGQYAGDMMDMIHGFGLKIMVVHHNFAREYYMDNKSFSTLWGLTSYWVNRIEKKAYYKSDCNCFLTPNDMYLFHSHYGDAKGTTFVIGVFEPAKFVNVPVGIKNEKQITITGSMNTLQTMCGIKDVQDNYYAIIRELCPEWDLVIAGRNPRQEVYELQKQCPDHIQVIPNPEVIDDITRPASIFLCPTNVGGGLKLRVMDGLRQGLPILVHKVSARGYNKFYEKPYFQIYHNKETFRLGLTKLLNYIEAGLDKSEIQKDYISLFGFERGCEIMKSAIDSIQN